MHSVAALIYGDGIITPAISGSERGRRSKRRNKHIQPYTMPIAVVILVGLFAIQNRGTGLVGRAFGPVMFVWFATIGILGVIGIVHRPAVLAAINPIHGAELVMDHGFSRVHRTGWSILALTGGEALYADMGHVGRNPIRVPGTASCCRLSSSTTPVRWEISWHLPIQKPTRFQLAPTGRFIRWLRLQRLPHYRQPSDHYRFVLMTRQAMQLGWFPGVRINQTSAEDTDRSMYHS